MQFLHNRNNLSSLKTSYRRPRTIAAPGQCPALADARIVSTMPRLPYDQLTVAPSRVQTAPGTHFASEHIQAQQGACCWMRLTRSVRANLHARPSPYDVMQPSGCLPRRRHCHHQTTSAITIHHPRRRCPTCPEEQRGSRIGSGGVGGGRSSSRAAAAEAPAAAAAAASSRSSEAAAVSSAAVAAEAAIGAAAAAAQQAQERQRQRWQRRWQ